MKLRIKDLREECGLTQKELARRIDNVQRNVSNWENGTSEPDCQTILRLADLFGVTVDELFGREQIHNDALSFSDDYVSLARLLRTLSADQRVALRNLIISFLR